MTHEEFIFTVEQSLPDDASPELIERTNTIKENAKVFFDYQDFYCEKHNVSHEVFDQVSKTKSENWAKGIMADEKIMETLTEEGFKEIVLDKMVDDVKEEGFEDLEGFRVSLEVLTSTM